MTVKDFDFSHYYTYDELVDYLSQMAKTYPKLTQLKVIGQSYAGRDIWLAIITNQETGNYLEKPGYWIDANTHAGADFSRDLFSITRWLRRRKRGAKFLNPSSLILPSSIIIKPS